MKVVINKCYGGFGVSPEAALWLYERGFREDGFVTPVEEYWKKDRAPLTDKFGHKAQLEKWHKYKSGEREGSLFITVFTPDENAVLCTRPNDRTHPLLIECVETLGEKANGSCSNLRIIEIPDGVEWEIDDYDGMESIAETHRSWG